MFKRKQTMTDKGFGISDKNMEVLKDLEIDIKLNKWLIDLRSAKYTQLINSDSAEYTTIVGELKGIESCMNALSKMNTYQKNLNKNKEK